MKIVCVALLSFTTPTLKSTYRVYEHEMVAPPPRKVYYSPPPAPPTPIFIWNNDGDSRNYGPRTDDYDGDGA